MKVTPYYIRSKIEDEEYLDFYSSLDELLTAASKICAFDDCCPQEILEVRGDGYEWCYGGWAPGMKYLWYPLDGKDYMPREIGAWVRYFPEWDH